MKVAIIYYSETGNTKKMAELIKQGCMKVDGVEARCMSVDDVDEDYVIEASAAILGTPTYMGTCCYQMKKYLDTGPKGLAGKLGSVFASQFWPGGGGASFAEMTIIAAMMVHGMLIYSGGTSVEPVLHFGAVSKQAPDEEPYRQRCIMLGKTITAKALEIFTDK